MTSLPSDVPPFRTKTWWFHTALAVAMVASPFVYFLVTARSGNGRLIAGLGLAVAALLAWRMGRAHIALDDQGVHVARIGPPAHIPWSDVGSVHVIRSGNSNSGSVALAVGRGGDLVRAPTTACGEKAYRETLALVIAAFESRGVEIHHR